MVKQTSIDKRLSLDELREFVAYDPLTGDVTWIVRRRGRNGGVWPGQLAGCIRGGYRFVRICGIAYPAHQLAWLFTYGVWPTNDVDHINRDKLDNRIANLRDVGRSINKQNLSNANRGSATGLLGVSTCTRSDRYRATIFTQGRQWHIGTFDTPEEAHLAYIAAKKQVHEGYVA